MPYDKKAYDKQYDKDNYDKILLVLPKGAKAELKSYAQANDLSLNQLILKAIEKQYLFDFSNLHKQSAK